MEKQELFKKQLLYNSVVNWCLEKQGQIVYNKSFDSETKFVRFSSNNLDSVIGVSGTNGLWQNGRNLIYEISIDVSCISVALVGSLVGLPPKKAPIYELLINSFKNVKYKDSYVQIEEFFSFVPSDDCSNVSSILNQGFNNKILPFESTLNEKVSNTEKEMHEGKQIELISQRYERNKEARAKCLEHHGYVCKICGFDAAAIYGNEFKNKIEVHHIVPLNQIKEDYVVDPINDLIPVCPNCHTILHSKPNGVYTPDEVRKFLKK